jgi:hypothetical protein
MLDLQTKLSTAMKSYESFHEKRKQKDAEIKKLQNVFINQLIEKYFALIEQELSKRSDSICELIANGDSYGFDNLYKIDVNDIISDYNDYIYDKQYTWYVIPTSVVKSDKEILVNTRIDYIDLTLKICNKFNDKYDGLTLFTSGFIYRGCLKFHIKMKNHSRDVIDDLLQKINL